MSQVFGERPGPGAAKFLASVTRRLPHLLTGVGLALGVPLMLRLPPWCDLTLYQTTAQGVESGGVLYRDVFDTNPPGYVLTLIGLRRVVGTSTEAVFAFDLALAAGAVWALSRLVPSGPGRAWLVAAWAWLYPFAGEFALAQRDSWMLTGAALATLGYRRAITRGPGEGWPWATALLAGVAAGWAVLVKPHAAVPLSAVLLAGAPTLLNRWGWRRGLGLVGLVVVAAAVVVGGAAAYLVQSGAWPHLLEVFTVWNGDYLAQTLAELPLRVPMTWHYFPGWSLVHAAALPGALALFPPPLRGRARVGGKPAGAKRVEPTSAPQGDGECPPTLTLSLGWEREQEAARLSRRLLAALYLGWFAQALLIQRWFDYVHLPETVLAVAVLAAWSWRAVVALMAVVVAVVAGGLGVIRAAESGDQMAAGRVRSVETLRALKRFPPAYADRGTPRDWVACFGPPTPELRDSLARVPVHCVPGWRELGEVEAFLRAQNPPVGDGELLAWNDGPHALYTRLGVRPGLRYVHWGTAYGFGPQRGRLDAEVRAATAVRFVVSDLARMVPSDLAKAREPGRRGPLDAPHWLPDWARRRFPWNQPILFRAGRYCVHRLEQPVGAVCRPDLDLGQLERIYGAGGDDD